MNKIVICCVVLLLAAAIGSAQVTCSAADDRHLKCNFPENITSAQKDFSLCFYPDIGGEEALLDCGWVKSKFGCITQHGFELNGPVSDTALITIPTRYLDKQGSYRCLLDGYQTDRIPPCRVLEKQVQFQDYSSTCEVETSGRQVNLKCLFSFRVDGFNIKKNSYVLAIYTKSVCLTSNECHYEREVNHDAFTVKLNVTEEPGVEYYCYPDVYSPSLEVTGCVAVRNNHSENSLAITLGVALPLISAALVALVLGVRKEMERRNKRVLYHAAHLDPSSTEGPSQRDSVLASCCPFSSGKSNQTADIFMSHCTFPGKLEQSRPHVPPFTGESNQTGGTFVPRGPPSTGESNQTGDTFVPRCSPFNGEHNQTGGTFVPRGPFSTGEPNQTGGTFVPRGPPSTGEPNQTDGTFA